MNIVWVLLLKDRQTTWQNGIVKYTYENISYIVNEYTGEEVTSFAKPIVLDYVPDTKEMVQHHQKAATTIAIDKTKWTSNTVIVVDTSYSMKNADVFETRTHLDAVWLCIALDFIAHRLESGAAGSSDVVSIVTLGENSEALVLEQPTSWILYNKIVDIYNNKTVQPQGHGPYIPSLNLAGELLNANSNASCAMGLLFISDGKPSDHYLLGIDINDGRDAITKRVASLASKFGRRLQFTAVGIGDEDFITLENMVDVASDYGAKASMNIPSKSAGALGDVLGTFATAIASTQKEMTCVASLKQQRVKTVTRESMRKANESITRVSDSDFFIYDQHSVQRLVYKEWREEKNTCRYFEPAPLQNRDAHYVAMHESTFGEGAERFAYRFFEVGADGESVIGKPLVAKESRFIVNGYDTEDARQHFVKTFCETQELASRIAIEFNATLDALNCVDKSTPRVSILDCSVYILDDINLGKNSVLVEEKLDQTKWMKWNSNNGFVAGMENAPTSNEDNIEGVIQSMNDLDICTIEEEEDDEGRDVSSNGQSAKVETNNCNQHLSNVGAKSHNKDKSLPEFSAFDVAQAFSHFSYWATGRKRLICDLQGVFDDGKNLLYLSDPVIHCDNRGKSYKDPCIAGRTDRGRTGMALFFKTHKCHCGKLCRLVTSGLKRTQRRN